MKITVAVLQGLLLVLVRVCSQQNYQQEPDKTYYFIYNTSVELKTYYCSQSHHEDLDCIKRNGKLLTDNFPDCIYNNCKTFPSIFLNLISRNRLKINLCELSVLITKQGKVVKFSDNKMCVYRSGTCYNENISKYVFWIVNDICLNLVLVNSGNFTVWRSVQDQSAFISDNITSLKLTEQIELCKFDMWKTNYEEVVVSKNFTHTEKLAGSPKLESNFKDFCGDKNIKKQTSKIWYTYKYPTNVTIHICFVNLTNSCQEMNLIEAVSKNNTDLLNQCTKNFYNISPCPYESEIVICEKTLQADLEKDLLIGLPQECKYSGGVCTSLNTFWRYTDRCDAIQKAYQGHEEQCDSAKCVIQDNHSAGFTLLREGKLCGRNIWYTNQNGLVASEEELQFSPSKDTVFKHKSHWNASQFSEVKEYFIISVLTVFLLFVGFKAAVSLIYLCTKCRKRRDPAVGEAIELRKMRVDLPIPQN